MQLDYLWSDWNYIRDVGGFVTQESIAHKIKGKMIVNHVHL